MQLRIDVEATQHGMLQRWTQTYSGARFEGTPAGKLLLIRCVGHEHVWSDRSLWTQAGREVISITRRPAAGVVDVILDGADDLVPIAHIEAAGARLIPPIVWTAGTARMSLVLDKGVEVGAILALFPQARLVGKRRVTSSERAAHFMLEGLTAKQARALTAAYDAGYYQNPRESTTQELAEQAGLARSTFEQHLNRAEHAVVEALMPIVRLRAEVSAKVGPKTKSEASSGGKGGDAAGTNATVTANVRAETEVHARYNATLQAFLRLELRREAVTRLDLVDDVTTTAALSEHPLLDRLERHIEGDAQDFADVTFDLDVTGFQKRVLDHLVTIPAGTTQTYGDIAAAIGKPGAARAVGTACAKNPALILIPCHRVVPAGGGFGNYAGAGGVTTKKRLLEIEKAREPTTPRVSVKPKATGRVLRLF